MYIAYCPWQIYTRIQSLQLVFSIVSAKNPQYLIPSLGHFGGLGGQWTPFTFKSAAPVKMSLCKLLCDYCILLLCVRLFIQTHVPKMS